jgi:hypothetical protein
LKQLCKPTWLIRKPTLQAFSDEHGTPAQRLFNLLCIAYGPTRRRSATS